MHWTLFLCLLKLAAADVVLQTSSGTIKGVTVQNGNAEAFLGIPYAEPPIGELRFSKPVPKKPWAETIETVELPPPCAQLSLHLQYYFLPNISNMSEDCLYLNIWTPRSVFNDTLKPVVIFFHHGAFVTGSASTASYDGAKFASRGDVVFVSINFRLGIFGFLYLDTEEANGNMAMYDQIMAIKWVKDNAKIFGGDPENFVFLGSSAGAVSVAMHMVSPISKGLLHKAILQTGGTPMPYFFENNRLLQNSKTVASMMDCINKTESKFDGPSVVSCLKHRSVNSILKAEHTLMSTEPFIFYPRMADAFLPEAAVELLRAGEFSKHIPILTGINNDDGPLFITMASPEYFGFYGQNNSQSFRKSLALFVARSLLSTAKVSNPTEVLDFYMSQVKNRSSQGYTRMIADLVGDYSVACCAVFQADIISLKGNPVYFYKFKFRSPSTPMAEWTGVTHLDELQYVFGNPYHSNFTKEEIELSHRMMDRWSTFAKTGDPNIPDNIPWLRYNYHNPLYLSIEQEEESIRMKPLERCKIWRKRFKGDIDANLERFLRNSGQD